MSDEPEDKGAARRAILARRARFVAAAVAGVGIACGKESSPPQPCLSVPVEHDAGAPPEPCLSVTPRVYDSALNDAAAGPDARPHPCLTPVRPPDKPPPAPKK